MKNASWKWLMGTSNDEERRAEIAEELAAHVALRAQDNEMAGMSRADAMRDARDRFGDADATTRACLAARRSPRRVIVAAGAAALVTCAGIGVALVAISPTDARARFARTAPYDGIRWTDGVPSVRVDGTWWRLEAIDGVATQDLLAASRDAFGDRWKKRFEEDIVEVLIAAGRTPGDTVRLSLSDEATGQLVERSDVPLTAENRRAIWLAANGERDATAGSLTMQGGRGVVTLAPYDAITWEGEVPRVRVDGRWVELIAIDGVAAADIVAFSKATFPEPRDGRPLWKKRFEEDLVEVLTRMDHAPQATVALRVRDVATGIEEVLPSVPMTGENRRAILLAARERDDR